MRKRSKNILMFLIIAFVFFVRLKQGLSPAELSPGMMPSGAMNAPIVAVFSALFLSGLTWALLEFLFWIFSKIKSDS